jgi:hypothetical protein
MPTPGKWLAHSAARRRTVPEACRRGSRGLPARCQKLDLHGLRTGRAARIQALLESATVLSLSVVWRQGN